MNNYILINRTYQEMTPESTEIGDFSDQGFITEQERVTFKELVKLMSEHANPSSSGAPGITWGFNTHSFVKDYTTGTDRIESIHYCEENTPNCEKYWLLARQFADKK